MERIREMLETDAAIISIVCFFGASFAGVARALRDGTCGVREVLAAVLNSGLAGLIVFLIGWENLHSHIHFLIGISILSGIGGATLLDLLSTILRRLIKREAL